VKNSETPRNGQVLWEKTQTQFLLRNSQSGIYYARLYVGGKEIWKSLRTDVYSVAKARLPELISGIEKMRNQARPDLKAS
jgi:hypothetical protein